MTRFREVTRRNYERAQRGEVVYLVAELEGHPVGQIQIDQTKRHDENVAVIWAFRVKPSHQNQGIGTQLLQAAEHAIRENGYAIAELGVAKDNPDAKRLYERLGYQAVSENFERWSYTTPAGDTHEVVEAEWVMHKALQ